jgi:hypothetical protein
VKKIPLTTLDPRPTLPILRGKRHTKLSADSDSAVGIGRVSARNRNGSPTSPFVKRQGGWTAYSFQKNAWIAAHPNASSAEIDAAAKRIARELGL